MNILEHFFWTWDSRRRKGLDQMVQMKVKKLKMKETLFWDDLGDIAIYMHRE